MKKRVVIVHCWDGKPNYCWYPHAKREFERKRYEVAVPEMPETGTPKLSLWLPVLKKIAEPVDEHLSLVGHSAGCITIMRFLESLTSGQRVGTVVFVAGFTDDLGYKELANFFNTPIAFDRIKKAATRFVVIHSDNDPYVALSYADVFKQKLNARVIVKRRAGHFSGPIDDEKSCTRLDEAVEAVIG